MPANKLYLFASSSLNLLSSNITIQSGLQLPQKVRMRVLNKIWWLSKLLPNLPYGEVEDYSVNIKAAGTSINQTILKK